MFLILTATLEVTKILSDRTNGTQNMKQTKTTKQNCILGVKRMVQQLRALASFTEDLGSISSVHMVVHN